MDIQWTIKKFEELSARELYKIIVLREKVFVVEQKCVYQDTDGIDLSAYHVQAITQEMLVAYCRFYYLANGVHIGRVVVDESCRGRKLAYSLMAHAHSSIRYLFPQAGVIRISAQKYLQTFYEKIGYRVTGDVYLEDGIPHVAMYKLLVHS